MRCMKCVHRERATLLIGIIINMPLPAASKGHARFWDAKTVLHNRALVALKAHQMTRVTLRNINYFALMIYVSLSRIFFHYAFLCYLYVNEN